MNEDSRSAKQRWLSKDLWSDAELQQLCSGYWPDVSKAPEEFEQAVKAINTAAEDIRRAVLKRILPVSVPADVTAADRLYGHSRFFDPAVAIRWAAPKFERFPFKVSDIHTAASSVARPRGGNRSKLTELQQTEVRRRLTEGATPTELAKDLRVDRATIYRALKTSAKPPGHKPSPLPSKWPK